MNATAPRPITATSAPNPGDAVLVGVGACVGGWVAIVVGTVVMTGCVATVVTGAVVGTAVRTLNRAVPVAPGPGRPTDDAVTSYSSGLNVDASTSNETAFRPLVPCVTCTVPDAPLNSPLADLSVGWNDDE